MVSHLQGPFSRHKSDLLIVTTRLGMLQENETTHISDVMVCFFQFIFILLSVIYVSLENNTSLKIHTKPQVKEHFQWVVISENNLGTSCTVVESSVDI